MIYHIGAVDAMIDEELPKACLKLYSKKNDPSSKYFYIHLQVARCHGNGCGSSHWGFTDKLFYSSSITVNGVRVPKKKGIQTMLEAKEMIELIDSKTNKINWYLLINEYSNGIFLRSIHTIVSPLRKEIPI